MYGYDAGVLGGVQTTKPYLDALGVCRMLTVCLAGIDHGKIESERHIRDSHDSEFLYFGSSSLLIVRYYRRNAPRSTTMHYARRCTCHRWSKHSGLVVVCRPDHRRPSTLRESGDRILCDKH